jgi:hypothetical protein
MKQSTSKILVAALIAITLGAPAKSEVKSKSIVVESPSDLPELSRGRSEAMYLLHTHQGQAILYLERDHGKTLAILDVTNPANIKAVGQVSVDAPASYDFAQYLGGLRTLIHYRNHSGFAVLNFKDYKQPMLMAEPEYLHPATADPDGPNGLLLVSSGSSSGNGNAAPARDSQYEVLTISSSAGATPLATIPGVIQRVDRPQTGTIFLLNEQGLTVVRYVAAELNAAENWESEQP